jgi:DNA repair protein RecN (Recombination protein N)
VIEEIRITGLGVIDEAVVTLGPGLTVVTGETGAGKTMVVTSIGLLLGARADAARVRSGHASASVEGRVVVDPTGPVAERVREAGGDLDEDVLLVARTVSAEGRSRAHLGGRGVPVALLSELAEELVSVHGQSDQQGLLRPARQRLVVDGYAGKPLEKALVDYRKDYQRLKALDRRLDEVGQGADAALREIEDLQAGLLEVEKADPQPGEDHALSQEAERLAHGDALRTAAEIAHASVAGDETIDAPDVLALLGGARRAIEPVRDRDPELAALADRIVESSYVLGELAADLSSYAAAVETDPARLAAVEDRRAVLGALLRRLQVSSVDEALAWAARAVARLGELEHSDSSLAELEAERVEVRARLSSSAGKVSAARRKAATRLGSAVTQELAHLAMPSAAVEVSLTRRADPAGLEVDGERCAFGPDGVDELAILLRPHPGSEPLALTKGASGGELSRVMLAIEVVLAGVDPVPTFVFDEVDAGVGGRAATEVGSRLAALARSAQVVVVTHLPQVAAFADAHLVVEKSDDGRVTSSDVVTLDHDGRVRELSRMLAGMEDSELGQAHAEELLAAAGAARATARS